MDWNEEIERSQKGRKKVARNGNEVNLSAPFLLKAQSHQEGFLENSYYNLTDISTKEEVEKLEKDNNAFKEIELSSSSSEDSFIQELEKENEDYQIKKWGNPWEILKKHRKLGRFTRAIL